MGGELAISGAAALTAIICILSVPATAAAASNLRCEPTEGGVEYRAYLPDQKRYIYVAVKALSGYVPSIFVTIDKNYDAVPGKPGKDDPLNAWWIDRSKPMTFSSDKIAIRWPKSGTWTSLTSWISSPDWKELAQPIRGLAPEGGRFVGAGSPDANTFAFETRVELTDFNTDAFEVAPPAVTYDGVTVTPPVVHFDREDRIVKVHC